MVDVEVGTGCTAPPPPVPPLVPPVPPREIVCGESPALLVSTSDALRAPTAPGEKVTPTAQVAPTGTLDPEQVSVATAKSPAFVPVTVDAPAPNVKVPDPELVTANVVAEDVDPVVTVPNDPDVGAILTAGAVTCTEPIVNAPNG